jgi:para-aminobenzoate synthetase/4-amino-4-deoxychorismate lyase
MKAGINNEKPFSLLTSVLWTPEDGFFLLDQHLQRLERSANYFGFAYSRPVIQQHLQQLTVSLSQPHKVRLTVDSVGHPAGEAVPLVLTDRPVQAVLAAEPVDAANPFLYHKTTNREIYDRALAARPGPPAVAEEVIMWNHQGEITEATIANVVVRRGAALYTPPVACGLLPGVFRAYLLAQGRIQERAITIPEFYVADQVFLINSVRRWRDCILVQRPAGS